MAGQKLVRTMQLLRRYKTCFCLPADYNRLARTEFQCGFLAYLERRGKRFQGLENTEEKGEKNAFGRDLRKPLQKYDLLDWMRSAWYNRERYTIADSAMMSRGKRKEYGWDLTFERGECITYENESF